MGAVVRQARAERAEGHSLQRQPDRAPSISPARRTARRASTTGTRTTSRRASRVAWTPTERMVVRGGYSKVFDRVGVGLATNFDEGFAFGMSTQISSPFGAAYETNPGRALPSTPPRCRRPCRRRRRAASRRRRRVRAGIITQSIDDTLVTPSAHMASAIIGFDLSRNYTFEAGYVGRFGRDLLVRRDLAMPLNLVDPASRTDYFTAAQTIISAAQAAGITGNSRAAAMPACRRWRTGRTSSRRRRRRPDGHAGDHARLHAERAGLDHGALRHGHLVRAGVQQVRPVRLLRRAVRFARRRSARSAARTTTA